MPIEPESSGEDNVLQITDGDNGNSIIAINGSDSGENTLIITNDGNSRNAVQIINDNSKYYAEKAEKYAQEALNYRNLAAYYAEQANQDVEAIIEGFQGTDNIVVTKEGSNITVGTKHYEHYQAVASDEWEIQHNLNKMCPRVTLVDSNGAIYYPAVNFIDENNCVIYLLGQMTGTAYLE